MASGRETREYRSLLENMDIIINHLRVDSVAKQDLIVRYQTKQWIDIFQSPDESTLVRVALSRISQDTTQYYIFMDMLRGIVGMSYIVEKIQGTTHMYSS